GAVEGYNYSGALRNKSFTWNEKTLFDLFYQGPDKFLPGTKMPVQQVPDKEQLANLVDYLRVLTTGAAKQ
ncbi:MAG: cytochrome c, partial [Rhodospirillales bacterium]